MRTITIIGTDISGPQPWWDIHTPEENPILDATHRFDRAHRPSMDHQYREIADVAQFDGIAIGLRGKQDAGFAHFGLLRDAIRETPRAFSGPAPTIMPWCDTGAMTDYHNYDTPDGQQTPFDFANPAHLAGYWTHVLGPYFETFPEGGSYANPIQWERTPDGRIVIAFWGISPSIGHGIVNQHRAQALLDVINTEMQRRGIGTPAFIIDDSWPEQIQAYGKHGWFDPGQNRPFTVTTFNGVKTGVLVAGFHDPYGSPTPHRRLDRRNGNTLRDGLAVMRAERADYVLYESYNNRVESAGLYTAPSWGTLYLDIVREHIHQTTGVRMPVEPVTPPKKPAKAKHTATFAISKRESFEHPTKKGCFVTWYPKGQRETILSVQANGDVSTRLLNAAPAPDGVTFDHTKHGLGGVAKEWETWTPEGNRAVFETSEYYAIPLVK